jgi:hypothetical protein
MAALLHALTARFSLAPCVVCVYLWMYVQCLTSTNHLVYLTPITFLQDPTQVIMQAAISWPSDLVCGEA